MTAAREPEKMSEEEIDAIRKRRAFVKFALGGNDTLRLLATYDSMKSRAERLEKALEDIERVADNICEPTLMDFYWSIREAARDALKKEE